MKDYEQIIQILKGRGVPETDAIYWANDWEHVVRDIPIGSEVQLAGQTKKLILWGITQDGGYYDNPMEASFNVLHQDHVGQGTLVKWPVEKVLLKPQAQNKDS